MKSPELVIATRPSKLARWQAQMVQQALREHWPDLAVRTLVIETRGDRSLDRPLPEIGGKGLFTAELERTLREGGADLAVHSLKDLPVENPAGLSLGAIPRREDPRDVLVAPKHRTLADLAPGTTVGTSSNRRAAQILALRPDLRVRSIRGNVDTRVRKVREGEYDAAVMAAAGLLRLGLEGEISQWFSVDEMLPAPGQGALAVQCRSDDASTLRLLEPLEDGGLRNLVAAERAFLQGLGGGCAAPAGALATHNQDGIQLQGMIASLDGERVVRRSVTGSDPEQLGLRLAEVLLEQGARELIADVG